ncbi:unnamed protein product, partial [Polarella glacialis]
MELPGNEQRRASLTASLGARGLFGLANLSSAMAKSQESGEAFTRSPAAEAPSPSEGEVSGLPGQHPATSPEVLATGLPGPGSGQSTASESSESEVGEGGDGEANFM